MMKKLLLVILCMVMVVCLCACGGGKDEPAVTAEPTAEATQEPTPEPTYVGMTEVLSGLWIPELPFTGWEGMFEDPTNSYQLTTFEAYYDPASDGKYESTEEMFEAYAMSFADYGYTVTQVGDNEYKVEGEGVKSIFLNYPYAGYAQITIYR